MKMIEKSVNINEAMQLWKDGKAICCKIDGTNYAVNANYTEYLEKGLRRLYPNGEFSVLEIVES